MVYNPKKYIPTHDSDSFKLFPFFWITRINGKYINLIEKSLKKINLDNTKRKILMSIDVLSEPNITEISNFAYTKLTTTTKCIYKLQEQGLVICESSEKDERITVVKLTEQGMEKIKKINEIHEITLSGVFSKLEEAQMQQLNHLLIKLYKVIPE